MSLPLGEILPLGEDVSAPSRKDQQAVEMSNTKNQHEEESKKQYEELLDEILGEMNKQISQRNKEHFKITLELFTRAGLTHIDHSNWRDADMLPAMLQMLIAKHRQLNPWKYEQYCYEHDPAFDTEPETKQKEIYPGVDRLELETLAVDQYITYSNKTEPKAEAKGQKENKCRKKEKSTPVENRKGNLPEISPEDLVKTGLTDKEVVDDWVKKNPEKVSAIEEVDKDDLARDLSQATSRTKKNQEKQGPIELPMRCHKSKKGRWYEYALTYAGKPGEGNKYGIIRTSLSTDKG